jgi:hypothetical protein
MIIKIKSAMNKYLIIVFIVLFFGCNNEENNYKLEKTEVFNDVFIKLVDSTTTDFRRLIVPSPKDLLNEESKKEFYKKIDSLQEIMLPPLKVVIEDSLYKLNLSAVKHRIKNHLNEKEVDEIINFNDSLTSKALDLNLSNFSNKKYNFIYKNDLDGTKKQRGLGKYSFSELHFNKAKTVCVFSYEIYYSKLNGSAFLCILKKHKDKWQIYKTIQLSIS